MTGVCVERPAAAVQRKGRDKEVSEKAEEQEGVREVNEISLKLIKCDYGRTALNR